MPTIIASILSIISNVVGGISAEQQAKIALELQANADITQLLTAQAQIDANEAANPNWFVAGARPMILWGLGLIVVFYAFLTLIINFLIAFHYQIQPMPPLDPMVRDIVVSMLGLSIGSRTFEKWKNVQNNH